MNQFTSQANQLLTALLVLTGGLGLQSCSETPVEKAKTKIDEITKDTKENLRDAQKDLRDATGNSSITKDVGDKLQNAADEVEFQAKKAKRKAD